MQFCTNCGAKMSGKFCTNCGNAGVENVNSTIEPTYFAETVSQQAVEKPKRILLKVLSGLLALGFVSFSAYQGTVVASASELQSQKAKAYSSAQVELASDEADAEEAQKDVDDCIDNWFCTSLDLLVYQIKRNAANLIAESAREAAASAETALAKATSARDSASQLLYLGIGGSSIGIVGLVLAFVIKPRRR